MYFYLKFLRSMQNRVTDIFKKVIDKKIAFLECVIVTAKIHFLSKSCQRKGPKMPIRMKIGKESVPKFKCTGMNKPIKT